jgi:hypothetical protein
MLIALGERAFELLQPIVRRDRKIVGSIAHSAVPVAAASRIPRL